MVRHYDSANISAYYQTYRAYDLIIDSRRVRRPAESLFFALPGRKRHGAEFVGELVRQGLRHLVLPLDRQAVISGLSDSVTVIITDDPIALLQDLAAFHRRQFSIPVIGITGSNGKTIVKDWLAQVLATKYKVCASPRSYNSQIGVPLSIWQLDANHEIAVFEAGISRVGEMERLARIIRPTHGIFTMLGSAHAEGFPNEETKLKEKLLLFAGASLVVLPGSEFTVPLPARWLEAQRVDRAQAYPFRPDLPMIYRHNAGLVARMAAHLEVADTIIDRLALSWRPLQNRLEQTEGLHGAPVINDSYSNDMDALAAAVDYAASQSATGKIHLILGSVQGGKDGGVYEDPRVSSLFRVGARAGGEGRAFATTENLLRSISDHPFTPLPILVKGASYERMDRVAAALSRKQHRTVLRVDLGAVQHNLAVYQKGTEAKMIVMVKASAYGGGSLPVARAVAEAGADYLAVAYTDEGVELRKGGIQLPIMVLNPEGAEFGQLVKYNLEPVVGTEELLDAANLHYLPVHLEVDTGMARLGFSSSDIDRIAKRTDLPLVRSVFSHLVASEAPEHDAFTERQAGRFVEVSEKLAGTLGYRPLRHLLNSNGISRWPKYSFGAVRLGIGLYGIGDARLKDQLRPAFSLRCRIAAISEREAGETIGYGRRGVLTRASRIATISIGYADGLPRSAGEGRFAVAVRGQLAPTVGAVCMDMTMVDVTDIPGVRVGEEVVVIGAGRSVEVLAEVAGTIPYEVLTGVGRRVHRVYVRE